MVRKWPIVALYALLVAFPLRASLAGEAAGALRCWRLDEGGSRLAWTAEWAGSAIEGGFSRFAARIRFSPDALRESRIEVRVPLASLVTEDPEVRDLLAGEAWFSSDRFPEAVYRSSIIESRGQASYHARGTLSLKGVTHPLGLDFSLVVSGNRAHVEGGTVIDRRSFGIGGGPLDAATAREVEVRFILAAETIPCTETAGGRD